MPRDTTVAFRQPEAIDDPLSEVAREGARRMLAQVLIAEADSFVAVWKDWKLPHGRDRVVRHGHGPDRAIQTGIGPVEVRRAKVRDRGDVGAAEKIRFTSSILSKRARRLPVLYLRGCRPATSRRCSQPSWKHSSGEGTIFRGAQEIASASSSSDRRWTIIIDADPFIISTDIAMPLGLIVNELVTNAIQHSRPADEGGSVHVKLEAHVDNFLISVSDPGDGPAAAQTGELTF
jgi:hypothetical protein